MNKLVLVFMLAGLFACDGFEQQGKDVYIPEGMGRRDEMRFKQYMVQGKRIYLSQCASCHKADGTGMQKLYPPLAKADYLLNNLDKSICMVQNGYTEPLTVNGTEYNMMMPEFKKLSSLEVAEVMTYIGNKWGNKMGFIEVNQVERTLRDCN
ncbi:MAG: c-type cytochrome [Cyclobacteriaceae bacterium]